MIAVADKKYTLRIPEELHAALEQIAERDRRSLHAQIITMLEESAAHYQRQRQRQEESSRQPALPYEEAAILKQQIERQYPHYQIELRHYVPDTGWVLIIKNTRTGKEFGVRTLQDWTDHVASLE
jgi:hypothetical protein